MCIKFVYQIFLRIKFLYQIFFMYIKIIHQINLHKDFLFNSFLHINIGINFLGANSGQTMCDLITHFSFTLRPCLVPKSKTFHPSIKMFRNMYRVLNVDKKKNNYTVCV
jgi:hypothetical protein